MPRVFCPQRLSYASAHLCASFLAALPQVKKLFSVFPDVLSSDGLTASKPHYCVLHHLLTASGPPVNAKPCCLDPEKLAAAKAEFTFMEKAGIIRRSLSPGPPLSTWLRRRTEAGGFAKTTDVYTR